MITLLLHIARNGGRWRAEIAKFIGKIKNFPGEGTYEIVYPLHLTKNSAYQFKEEN